MSRMRYCLQLLGEALRVVPTGKPFVVDSGKELSLHFDACVVQSAMRHHAPDELVLGYTRTMMSFLLFVPAPRRVAMIGLGGGSLAKYIHRHLPDTHVTAVEIDPNVIALRKRFTIPDDSARFRVLCLDGADYVVQAHDSSDVLLVDGFDVSGQPPQLCSEAFYGACLERLAPRGVLVVNLWTAIKQHALSTHRIHRVFGHCVLRVPAEESGNSIVFAWKDAAFASSAGTLEREAKRLKSVHGLDFPRVARALVEALKERRDTSARRHPAAPYRSPRGTAS